MSFPACWKPKHSYFQERALCGVSEIPLAVEWIGPEHQQLSTSCSEQDQFTAPCVFLQVGIRFPQPGSGDPDKVTVTGLPENVDKAIDHLLNLEEEYVSVGHWYSANRLSSVIRLWLFSYFLCVLCVCVFITQMLSVTETETLAAYMKPPSRYVRGGDDEESRAPAKGFVVRDAPWNVPGSKVTFISRSSDWSEGADSLPYSLHQWHVMVSVVMAHSLGSVRWTHTHTPHDGIDFEIKHSNKKTKKTIVCDQKHFGVCYVHTRERQRCRVCVCAV